MKSSIILKYSSICFVLMIGIILLFSNSIFARGALDNTLISQKFFLNSSSSSFVVGDPLPSDTRVEAVYGIEWAEPYFARPIESNNEIVQIVPNDTYYLTYQFFNRSNANDTIYLTVNDFQYSGNAANWRASVWNETLSEKLGDTFVIFRNIYPDSLIIFKLGINISDSVYNKLNGTGSCTVSIYTGSIPSGIYQGDNKDTYAGNAIITDIDDNERTTIRITLPEIKITFPETNHDTAMSVITVFGIASNVHIGDTVQVYVNGIYQSETNIIAGNIWACTALLANFGDSITAKIIDRFGNENYDTVTVNYFGQPPAADYADYVIQNIFDSAYSITLRWYIADYNKPAVHKITGFNLYEYANGNYTKLNQSLIPYINDGSFDGKFNISMPFDKTTIYGIETVDTYSRVSSMKFITIGPFVRIHNMKIRCRNYPDSTSINVYILDSSGKTATTIDSYPITAGILKKSKTSAGKFLSDTVVITNGIAAFEYSTTENNVIIIELKFLNISFKGYLFLRKYPESIPIIFMGAEYKNSIGFIQIEEEAFDKYFSDSKLIITNFTDDKDSYYRKVVKANDYISAVSQLRPLSAVSDNNIISEHKFFVIDSNEKEIHLLPAPIVICFNYKDENKDGIIDGTEGAGGINEKTLKVYYLNELTEKWEIVPDYNIDAENKIVQAKATHFSIYSIIGSIAAVGIQNLIVYPNPFKPGIDPTHQFVYFDNVPPGAKLRIFNVVGQLISEAVAPAGTYQMRWDGKNDYGQKVAPGVYLYLLEYNSEKKIGKIILVR